MTAKRPTAFSRLLTALIPRVQTAQSRALRRHHATPALAVAPAFAGVAGTSLFDADSFDQQCVAYQAMADYTRAMVDFLSE